MNLSADTERRINAHIVNLASSDDKVSQAAEYRLTRFGSKAMNALIEATKNPNPQVRFRAVWALGKIRDARAFDTIVALTDDGDEAVWYDATLALGNLKDARAIPLLVALIYQREQDLVRSGVAASALMKFGEVVIPILEEMVEKGSEQTRQLALGCLEDFEESRLAATTAKMVRTIS